MLVSVLLGRVVRSKYDLANRPCHKVTMILPGVKSSKPSSPIVSTGTFETY